MPLSDKKKVLIDKMIMKSDYDKTRFFFCTYQNEFALQEGKELAEHEF
jgi:hypothetical protein